MNNFKWDVCMGSEELYFRIGYYEKFFLKDGLENVFEEHQLEDEDCGILFSYYLTEK